MQREVTRKQAKKANSNMSRLTDNTIMLRLQSTAVSRGIKITYTQKLFYIRLLVYASKHGESCPEGFKISMSVDELSDCLSISKRMVIQSLRVLSDCGILLRYKGERSFPRSADVTILKKEFYERSDSDDSERGFV